MVLSIGTNKIKTAVFISGTGSNLKALIRFSKLNKSPISINLIITNNKLAQGLKYGDIFHLRFYLFSQDFKQYLKNCTKQQMLMVQVLFKNSLKF